MELQTNLAWCIEFLEHVEERYIDNYMNVFTSCKYAICTAAPPAKTGHHHVNCQTKQYWINVFNKYNFKYSAEITDLLKQHSTMTREFFRENGMFFINRKDIGE